MSNRGAIGAAKRDGSDGRRSRRRQYIQGYDPPRSQALAQRHRKGPLRHHVVCLLPPFFFFLKKKSPDMKLLWDLGFEVFWHDPFGIFLVLFFVDSVRGSNILMDCAGC